MSTTEDKEAAIIRRVYLGPYAHAENIMHRLTHLHREMPHSDAIDVLYKEVIDEEL